LGELSAEKIRAGLRTECLGRQVLYQDRMDSTNSIAGTLARQGAPDGFLVIADEQTAGRGRLGRAWVAPPGGSLLFSLILRPGVSPLGRSPHDLDPRRAQTLTMVCGLGVRQAISETTGLQAQLKWPNDILLSGLKAGGILCELGLDGPRLEYAVVGIGLNVNVSAHVLPAEYNATSISRELGRRVSRLRLLCAALLHIEQGYRSLLAGAPVVAEWAAALQTIGQRVELRTTEGILKGIAEGVDADGALLLRLDSGQVRPVLVGDVTVP
jgi:BirA family biotin operon repressor/biotin-[acetyl-CoA-carboxylase] ligase